MKTGQVVEVQEAFERRTLKRVVDSDSNNVYVCTEEEFNAAAKERREAVCVGFARQFILGIVQ